MKILRSDDGFDVYRLESILDIAILPEEVWERNGGWMMLEAAIHTLRLHLLAVQLHRGDEATKELLDALQPYLDIKDDGETYVQASVNSTPLMKVFVHKNQVAS